ncbi:hypothetical protein [Streptomyces sp. MMBL 11-1]|uniref:hypothetical protein n=1 Tax=Streptomyces sp. MMBL 11-1 TaxID=3026420 RepID=UPI002360CBC4|nr:hypothetical protein [Streptomyces sp. MMBL 11-1]
MRFVVVSIEDFDKTIKFGPLELNDPSEYVPAEGTRLMPEEEALTAGYHYAEGGAGFAPDEESHGNHAAHGQDADEAPENHDDRTHDAQ